MKVRKLIALFLCCCPFFSFNNLPAQNVGIGITNPTRAKLEVNGAVSAATAIFGGEGAGISLQRDWPGIGFNSYYNNAHRYLSNGYGALQFVDPNSGYMAIDIFANGIANYPVTDSRRVLVISKEGRTTVGAGNLTSASLEVARGAGTNGTAVFYGSSAGSYFNADVYEHTYVSAGKANGSVFLNDIPGGKVILANPVTIGSFPSLNPLLIVQTPYPNAKSLVLVEPDNFNYWHFFLGSVTADLYLQFRGNNKGYFNHLDGHYAVYSDRRLKTNITPLNHVLAKIDQFRPVEYEMLNHNTAHKKDICFIAQEVKKVFPMLVNISEDTRHGYKGIDKLYTMNYSALSVIAIKAIQEQQQIIRTQDQAIRELEYELEELEKTAINKLQTLNKQ